MDTKQITEARTRTESFIGKILGFSLLIGFMVPAVVGSQNSGSSANPFALMVSLTIMIIMYCMQSILLLIHSPWSRVCGATALLSLALSLFFIKSLYFRASGEAESDVNIASIIIVIDWIIIVPIQSVIGIVIARK